MGITDQCQTTTKHNKAHKLCVYSPGYSILCYLYPSSVGASKVFAYPVSFPLLSFRLARLVFLLSLLYWLGGHISDEVAAVLWDIGPEHGDCFLIQKGKNTTGVTSLMHELIDMVMLSKLSRDLFTNREKLNRHYIAAWVSNDMHAEEWDVIIHPLPNFSSDLHDCYHLSLPNLS